MSSNKIQGSEEVPTPWKELKKIRFVVLVALCIVFMLISIILELQIKGNTTLKHIFKDSHLYINLFREISFAIFIALLVWISFERIKKHEDSVMIEKFRDNLRKDIIGALIGLQLPSPIRKQLLETICCDPIVRSSWKVTCTFKELETDLYPYRTSYLSLEVTSEFYIENTGDYTIDKYKLKVFCPIPHKGIPKKHFGLKQAILDQQTFDIEKSRKEIILGEVPHHQYQFDIKLQPEEKKKVRLEYILLKRISDSELITSVLPSTDLSLKIDNRYNSNLEWELEPLHEGKLNNVGSINKKGITEFEMDIAIIKYQGCILSWRSDISNHSVITSGANKVYSFLDGIIKYELKRNKDNTLKILGLTLSSTWIRIKELIENKKFSNWEIRLFLLSPNFLKKNDGIFPSEWQKESEDNIKTIRQYLNQKKRNLEDLHLSIKLIEYEHFPAFHGFLVGNEHILCAPIHWGDTHVLKDPFEFYEYFTTSDNSDRSKHYRKLFLNWIDRAEKSENTACY